MVMCVYGRGRGFDGAGVFSPLWLCLQYQPLHGRTLPVAADVVVVVVVAAAAAADAVVVVVVVVVVVGMMVIVCGRGRGMDGAGIVSPLWLWLRHQLLHGRLCLLLLLLLLLLLFLLG